MSHPPPFNDFDALCRLDDTARLAFQPLNKDACLRLENAGLVQEEAGWWRITPQGRLALAAGALPHPAGDRKGSRGSV